MDLKFKYLIMFLFIILISYFVLYGNYIENFSNKFWRTELEWEWNGKRDGNPPPDELVKKWIIDKYYPLKEASYDSENKYNIAIKYVKLETSGKYPITISEVQVIDDYNKNVALGKSVMSSTKDDQTCFYVVDGNINGTEKKKNITNINNNEDEYSWLEINLQNEYHVKEIVIYNRSDKKDDIGVTDLNVILMDSDKQIIKQFKYGEKAFYKKTFIMNLYPILVRDGIKIGTYDWKDDLVKISRIKLWYKNYKISDYAVVKGRIKGSLIVTKSEGGCCQTSLTDDRTLCSEYKDKKCKKLTEKPHLSFCLNGVYMSDKTYDEKSGRCVGVQGCKDLPPKRLKIQSRWQEDIAWVRSIMNGWKDNDGNTCVDYQIKTPEKYICSLEGSECKCSGTVTYGTNENFIEKKVDGSIMCNNESFGSDPKAGAPKKCICQPKNLCVSEVSRSSSSESGSAKKTCCICGGGDLVTAIRLGKSISVFIFAIHYDKGTTMVGYQIFKNMPYLRIDGRYVEEFINFNPYDIEKHWNSAKVRNIDSSQIRIENIEIN